MIRTGCLSLEYFTNNKFIFTSHKYNAAFATLNEIDKNVFYDRSTVNFNSYSEIFISVQFYFDRFLFLFVHMFDWLNFTDGYQYILVSIMIPFLEMPEK